MTTAIVARIAQQMAPPQDFSSSCRSRTTNTLQSDYILLRHRLHLLLLRQDDDHVHVRRSCCLRNSRCLDGGEEHGGLCCTIPGLGVLLLP